MAKEFYDYIFALKKQEKIKMGKRVEIWDLRTKRASLLGKISSLETKEYVNRRYGMTKDEQKRLQKQIEKINIRLRDLGYYD